MTLEYLFHKVGSDLEKMESEEFLKELFLKFSCKNSLNLKSKKIFLLNINVDKKIIEIEVKDPKEFNTEILPFLIPDYRGNIDYSDFSIVIKVKSPKNNKKDPKRIFLHKLQKISNHFKNFPKYWWVSEKIFDQSLIGKIIEESENFKQDTYIFFKFEENGKILYPIDIPEIKDFVFRKIYQENIIKEPKKGKCSLCGKEGKVYGNIINSIGLKFSTMDKITFLSDGGLIKDYTSYLSLCEKCALKTYLGGLIFKKYADEILNWRGYRFMIIPFISSENYEQDLKYKRFIRKIINKNKIDGILLRYFPEKDEEGVYSEEIMKKTRYLYLIMYKQNQSEVKVYDVEFFDEPHSFIKIKKCLKENSKKFENFLEILEKYYKTIYGEMGDRTKEHIYKEILKKFFRLLKNQKITTDLLNLFYQKYTTKIVDNSLKNITLLLKQIYDIETCYFGGDYLKIDEILKKDYGLLAYETGKLAAATMMIQRLQRNVKFGEEPFRTYLASKRITKLKDIIDIFIHAFNKIQQYGGNPTKYTDLNLKDLKDVDLDRTYDPKILAFLFSLGIVDFEKKMFEKEEVKENEQQ